ncbi:CxxxxCH/CxxCH domain c-type cytochrome [Anaeromyxobacter oryzisoli]|uniref:CxxxxCH/CxxCH domain c-type cytochrome n=1 Tax=Anaeromyxobacter oryzisoli TaxID=2925408 RepID=UPI001F5AA020|nr:CxxxxCH/CxxCH domain-containing protein [Anaeromyxobacter sp. SG63]
MRRQGRWIWAIAVVVSALLASALALAAPPSPPGPPGTPTYSNVASTTLTVNWTAPTSGGSVASYTVQRSPDGTTFTSIVTGLAAGTLTYSDSGLTAATQYWYRIVAVGTGGAGSTTGSASTVTTLAPPAAPGTPGTPTYTSVAQTTLTVSWTAPTSGGTVSSYTVQRSPDGTSYTSIATGLTGLSYPDSGLTAGTRYWYQIIAVGPGGSTTGNASSVTTLAPSGATALVSGTDPAAVTVCPGDAGIYADQFGFTATGVADTIGNVTASGLGATPAISQLELRQDDGVTSVMTGTPAANTYTFTGANLAAPVGTTSYRLYFTAKTRAQLGAKGAFTVTPLVGAFTSTNAQSGSDTAQTFTIDNVAFTNVGAVSATASSSTAIALSWTAVAGASGYVVYAQDGGAPASVPTDGTIPSAGTPQPAGTPWVAYSGVTAGATASGLTAGHTYYFAVYARDPCVNWSQVASTAAATTLAPFIAEGDTTANSPKPSASIVNPAANAAVFPAFRVQARVASPNGAAITGVTLSWGGSSKAMARNSNYGTAADSGVYECTLTSSDVAAGGYTLVAVATNASGSVNSRSVPITVGTSTGDGNLLVRDDASQLCTDCHALAAHGSGTTSSQYGAWSTTCRDCHTPHGTTNLSLVAPRITPPAFTASQPAKAVSFLNKTGYAASSYASSAANGPCQVCHTRTQFYRADGTSPGGTHETGPCFNCHNHTKGLAASCTQCHGDATRTKNPAIAGTVDSHLTAAPPVDTSGATTGVRVGAHVAHVNQTTYRTNALACADCHPVPNTHQGTRDAAWSALASTGNGTSYTISPAAGPSYTTTWEAAPTCTNWCHGAGIAGGGSNTAPSWAGGSSQAACGTCHALPPPVGGSGNNHPQNSTCSSCHGAGYTGGATPSVAGAAKDLHVNGSIDAATGCAACHGQLTGLGGVPIASGDPRAAPGYDTTSVDTHGNSARSVVGVGAHVKHVNAGLMAGKGCSVCHGATPVDGDVSHANGTVAAGWNTPANAQGVTPTPAAYDSTWQAGPSCTNYCHSTGLPLGGTVSKSTVTWTSTTAMTCTSCHAYGASLTTNAHPKHVSTYGIGCKACHSATVSGDLAIVSGGGAHVNGTNDAVLDPSDPYPAGGSYDTTFHTCSATYCHSNGTTITAPFGAPTGSLAWNGGADTCTSCHGGPSGAAAVMGTTSGSTRHQNHVDNAAVIGTNYVCADCHAATVASGNAPLTNQANHLNRTKDISIATRGSYASSESYTGQTCSTTYCHSSGQTTPTYVPVSWTGAALGCNGCHGTSTTAGAPDYANGGAGTATANSHPKHTSLGSDSTSCPKCHAGTVAAAGGAIVSGSTLHTNGAHDIQIAAAYDTNGATANYDPATKTCSGISCHVGSSTWGGTLACTNCHGDAARTSLTGADANQTAAPPLGTSGESATTTRAVGAHVAHVNQATLRTNPLPCSECHLGTTHNGVKEVVWGTIATTGGAVPTWNGTTCATTYCHAPGGAALGGTNQTPSWTSGSSQAACGTCHGLPPPVGGVAGADHPQNLTCSSCHGAGYTATSLSTAAKATHIDGTSQKPANGCTACHGVLAGLTGAAVANTDPSAAPGYVGTATGVDTTGSSATTSAKVGAHDAHVRPAGSLNSVASLACASCHGTLPASGDTTHANGTIGLGWSTVATGGGTITPTPSAFGSTWEATPTCTNYCHSNASPTGGTLATATMTWTSTTTLTCSSCHATVARDRTGGLATDLSQKHGKHLDATTYAFKCDECHAATMTNDSATAIGTPANHVNGTKNVVFSTTLLTTTIDQSAGTYSTGTCASTYCHSNGTTTTAPFGTTVSAALAWTTGTSTCASCHGGPSGAAVVMGNGAGNGSAKHLNHVSNASVLGTNYVCGDCHAATVASGNSPITTYAKHVNGVKDVSIAARGTYTSSDTTGTCSATYCHSDGRRGAANTKVGVTWNDAAWTGNVCAKCHGGTTGNLFGAPDYANGGKNTSTANSHAKHVAAATDCATCHTTTTSTGTAILAGGLHTNGVIDVAFNAAKAGSGATCQAGTSTTSATCTNIACHGNNATAISWGDTGLTCINCHGGAADTDNWNISDGIPAVINTGTEWTTYGHGSNATTGTKVDLAQGKTGIDVCRYCHDWNVAHGATTNPFRLLGVTGANGAITVGNFNAATNNGNGVCWNCHGTGSNGVDPDGSGTAYLVKNGAKKIDAYHYGAGHTATTDGGSRCWDCHDPHGDGTNVAMIGTDTLRDSSDAYGLVGTRSTTGAVLTALGAGAYAKGTTPYTGVCQVCHTATKYYRYDGTLQTHNTGADCMSCHAHQQATVNVAFAGKGGGSDCWGCHSGGQGKTRALSGDFGLQSHHVRVNAGAFGAGSNVAGAGTNADCVVCHMEGQVITAYSADCGSGSGTLPMSCTNPSYHANGKIDLRDVDVAAPAADGTGTSFLYDKAAVAASAGAAANWNSSNQRWREWTSGVNETSNDGTDGALPSNAGLDKFCLNCHDSGGAAQISSFRLSSETSRTATDPFWDGAGNITNGYDTYNRADQAGSTAGPTTAPPTTGGHVIDIKSKVSGSPPAQGSFARHAIRGQSSSKYGAYTGNIGTGFTTMYDAGRFTAMGTDESGKPNWNDTSVMGCADCHTTDGANGTSGNAHGSTSEYLLKDASGAATEGAYASGTEICGRCHAHASYGTTHTGGNGSDFNDSVAQTGSARLTSSTPKGSAGSIFGIACLNCHGGGQGNGSGTGDTNGFGWIHGTSQVFPTGASGAVGTRNAYRFMNGSSLRFYQPGAATWDTGGGSCYTLANATTFGNCTQHSRSAGSPTTLKRPLTY